MTASSLPPAGPSATPRGRYVSIAVWRDLAFVAGHVSREQGQAIRGRLTGRGDIALGQIAARAAAQACLEALEARAGSLDAIAQVLSVRGFVVAAPRFKHHTQVLDAASEWIIHQLGERGHHARAVVGVASLPAGGVVEIELIAALHGGGLPKDVPA